MSSENHTPPGDAPVAGMNPAEDGPPPRRGNATRQPPRTVPYDRFQEVVSERNALKARLESVEEAEAHRSRSDLEENQNLKSLYRHEQAAREAADARARKWDDYQASRRDALLSKLATTEDREDLAELPLEKLERQVDRRSLPRIVGAGGNPGRPGRQPGREIPPPLSQLTSAERRETHMARLAAYQE